MTNDGLTRLRIKKIDTLENLRLKNARKIVLNLSSLNVEENIEQILNLMQQAEQQTREKLEKAAQPRRKQLNKSW